MGALRAPCVPGADCASVSILCHAFVLQTDGAEKQEAGLPVHRSQWGPEAVTAVTVGHGASAPLNRR